MKILIKGTNWIGDAVMSIPAMRRIRAAFPDAFIALHTRNWAEGIFRDSGLVDEIISFEPAVSKMRSVVQQSRVLRSFAFDAAVLFPNSFESAVTVAFARVPRRFGYRTDGRGFLLTDPLSVPPWKSERHESEYYLNLANAAIGSLGAGTPAVDKGPLLNVSQERIATALNKLASLGIATGIPVIAIGAGSTNSMAKRWPAAYFAELCDKLAERSSVNFILLGAPNEADVGRDVRALARTELFDLIGKTDLATATALLRTVDLFVSNDMGLAHISAALGTPTLTIFGPTNELATAPLGPFARYIREVVECSPCMLRECPIDHRCMKRLVPEMVFETATEMLQNRHQ